MLPPNASHHPSTHPSIHGLASPRLAQRQAHPSIPPAGPPAMRDYTRHDNCRARTRTASLSGRSSTINASRYSRARDPSLPATRCHIPTCTTHFHTCVHMSMSVCTHPPPCPANAGTPPDVQQKQISSNTCIAIQTRCRRRRHRSSPMHRRLMARSHHHVPALGRGLARPHWPSWKQTLKALP